jgi:putative peptidoglycan lipid II flippase
VLLIAIPATAALAILAEPLLATLFQYGAFSGDDRAMAAASLRAYTLGLGAFMLVKVLAPGFYAREDMRTPVRIGIIAMVANMVLNIAFVFPLMWWLNLGHVGLALATSVSAWLNALLLFRGLRRDAVLTDGSLPLKWLAQLGVATAAMVSVLLWLMPDHSMWAGWLWWQRALQLGILCGAGLGAFGVSLLCCGVRLADLRR